MKIEYPAIFDPADEGGYTITFPDFPEAISEGDTLEEANYNAIEVLDLTLKSRMEDNEIIPLPHSESGANVHMIAPDVNIQAALLVKLNRETKSSQTLHERSAPHGLRYPAWRTQSIGRPFVNWIS